MKKAILIIFLVNFCLLLSGQSKFPMSGDFLYYQVDRSPDIKDVPNKGKVKFWDYSFLQSPYLKTHKFLADSKKDFLPPKSNLTMSVGNEDKYFFQSAKTGFFLAGYSLEDPFGLGYRANVAYTNPLKTNLSGLKMGAVATEVSETYINYGIDNIKDDFLKKLPVLPDSIRLNVLITRRTRLDGSGRLFLPDITLNTCYRVTREETYDYTIDTKTGNLRWIDATDIFRENINNLPGGKTQILFYNDKYTLPVLFLTLDTESQKISKAEYLVPAKVALLKNKPTGNPDITLYPNPAYTKEIKLEVTNIQPGRYTFKIYSLIGKLEKAIPYYINNSKFDTIDISDFKPGIYIYALVDGSGKIMLSKRLTIISP